MDIVSQRRKLCNKSVLVLAILLCTSFPAAALGTIVSITTPLGTIRLEMLDGAAPQTVANFLNYVNDGDYANSFIHRSVPGFVIQGGGFTFSAGNLGNVPEDPPVVNEFNLSNVRGTVAMAKLGGDPDSATSQWFINLADNSEDLDNQNGGFTVFARVVDDDMAIVDAIAALQIIDGDGNNGNTFDNLPVIDLDPEQQALLPENLVTTHVTRGLPTPVLLRHATDNRWFGYSLIFDNAKVAIAEKGLLNLTRSSDYQTVSRSDFDGDGEPDLLIRDVTGGQNGRWAMYTIVGKQVTSNGFVNLTRNANWQIVSTDDFDGDGKADLLVRNRVDGRWLMYLLDTQRVKGQGILAMTNDVTDTVAGTGDFNGDGRFDVLLRRADGSWLMYLLDGLTDPAESMPAMTTNLDFAVQALAKFDADDNTDVLLRRTDGRWFMYMLNGPAIKASGPPAMPQNLAFSLASDADFNGDGNADALLRRSDGIWILYSLSGLSILNQGSVSMTRNTGFQIVSTEDFNGDGKADALLRRTDGRWVLYGLDGDGPTILGQGIPGMTKNTAWVPQTAQ